MTTYQIARDQLLQFFLTELSDTTPPSFVEDLAKQFLLRSHNLEWVNQCCENIGDDIIADLTDEYNRRIADGFPIYFEFIDDLGTKIRGSPNPAIPYNISEFQKALLRLTDSEFERLSGRILQLVGCTSAWVTPKSHDQGLDAFGCYNLFNLPRIPSLSNVFDSWILIQAKHYNKEMVCSSEIREFIGSVELARAHAFAVKGDKYPDLDVKLLTAITYIVVTSGEVKRTVHILADKIGLILLSACDLCVIFSTQWSTSPPTSLAQFVRKLRYEASLVPICR